MSQKKSKTKRDFELEVVVEDASHETSEANQTRISRRILEILIKKCGDMHSET